MFGCRAVGESCITEKLLLQTKIAQIPGVELVMACVSGTMSNSKKKGAFVKKDIRKCVAFFISAKSEAVEDEILKKIYKWGVPMDVKHVIPKYKSHDSRELALSTLCTVVKVF